MTNSICKTELNQTSSFIHDFSQNQIKPNCYIVIHLAVITVPIRTMPGLINNDAYIYIYIYCLLGMHYLVFVLTRKLWFVLPTRDSQLAEIVTTKL